MHYWSIVKDSRFTGEIMFTSKNLWLVVLLSVLLTSCANMTHRERNTAVGAAAGAVAGSILTGGSTAGTLGGAAVGGFIGNQIKR
jgi:osmotically inducible lipoprotein OsmB